MNSNAVPALSYARCWHVLSASVRNSFANPALNPRRPILPYGQSSRSLGERPMVTSGCCTAQLVRAVNDTRQNHALDSGAHRPGAVFKFWVLRFQTKNKTWSDIAPRDHRNTAQSHPAVKAVMLLGGPEGGHPAWLRGTLFPNDFGNQNRAKRGPKSRDRKINPAPAFSH